MIKVFITFLGWCVSCVNQYEDAKTCPLAGINGVHLFCEDMCPKVVEVRQGQRVCFYRYSRAGEKCSTP